MLPFGFYLLLVIGEDKAEVHKHWWVEAGLIFLLAYLAETGQYFGLYIPGRTFDALDFAMYALGVLLAAFMDAIFSASLKFWRKELSN